MLVSVHCMIHCMGRREGASCATTRFWHPQVCSTSTTILMPEVDPALWAAAPSVSSTNAGLKHRSMASSSTYCRAIAMALIAWLTLPAPMAVSSTRQPSRVQLAMAPASDFASVFDETLSERPSLSRDVRRERLHRVSCTAESGAALGSPGAASSSTNSGYTLTSGWIERPASLDALR